MKNFLLALLSLSMIGLAGCSEKKQTSVKPPSTPDAERLKSDSERLQQATANAAREREKALQTPSPTTIRQPKADLSPHTVPPQSPNPTP